MRTTAFRYKSVHDYLDEVLSENPTHAEIKQAKKEYWKKYNSHLKKERRKVLKYVSLSLSKAEYKQLKRTARQQGVSLYDYIREVSLNPQPFRIPTATIHKLEEISLKLQDLQEEMQEEDIQTNSFWERAYAEYENLRIQILNLKNQVA